jgi:hypothetical protein
MKTKLLLLAFLASNAHAALVDLTPGGFSKNKPPPVWVWLLTTQSQIAGANIINNQVEWSPFEPLGPKQFSIIPFGAKAVITWDTVGTGYSFQFLLLEGNNGRANIYGRTDDIPVGLGFVTIDIISEIQAITFYGDAISLPAGLLLHR